eukprot:753799-Hanusia_phi.AAC.2
MFLSPFPAVRLSQDWQGNVRDRVQDSKHEQYGDRVESRAVEREGGEELGGVERKGIANEGELHEDRNEKGKS